MLFLRRFNIRNNFRLIMAIKQIFKLLHVIQLIMRGRAIILLLLFNPQHLKGNNLLVIYMILCFTVTDQSITSGTKPLC